MSQETHDLIRWTFSLDASRQGTVIDLLRDYGAEVHTGPDGQILALWDETEQDLDAVAESLWEAAGGEFTITHEAFRRVETLEYHGVDDDRAAA